MIYVVVCVQCVDVVVVVQMVGVGDDDYVCVRVGVVDIVSVWIVVCCVGVVDMVSVWIVVCCCGWL